MKEKNIHRPSLLELTPAHQTPHKTQTALSTPDLIAAGRALIAETDASLLRSARSVAQTVEVGTRTAAALAGQTSQLERILDDADAMRGAARRARRVIVDVARGAATDRCETGREVEGEWFG